MDLQALASPTCMCLPLRLRFASHLLSWLPFTQVLQVRRDLDSLGDPDGPLPKQLPITAQCCPCSCLVNELDKAKALAQLAG